MQSKESRRILNKEIRMKVIGNGLGYRVDNTEFNQKWVQQYWEDVDWKVSMFPGRGR